MQFIKDFVNKIICVDPMDRKILADYEYDSDKDQDEFEDQGTKVSELLNIIDNLIPVDNKYISNPLTDSTQSRFD